MNHLINIDLLPNRILKNTVADSAEACIKSIAKSNPEGIIAAEKAKKCVSLGIDNVILHGSTERDYTINLSICSEDQSIIIELTDTGLPGDISDSAEASEIRSLADEYECINLLKKGRSQRIIFKFSSEIPEILRENTDDTIPITGSHINLRTTEDKDYPEIARAFYRDMGFTYFHKEVYDSTLLKEFLLKNNTHPLSAETDDGIFAGFHVLKEWSLIPGVYEAGMAIVNGRLRKCGAFSSLLDTNNKYFDEAVRKGVNISLATTNHDITQKIRLKRGFTPCGFTFNCDTANASQGVFRRGNIRYTLAACCHTMEHYQKDIYVPEEIIKVLDVIYNGENLPRTYITDHLEPKQNHCDVNSAISSDSVVSEVAISNIGLDYKDVLFDIYHALKECENEVCTMYVSVDKPGCVDFYEEAKRYGFRFTGLIPNTGYGDMMIMLNPINNLVRYDSIITTDSFTDMKNMLKEFDPDYRM